MSRGYRVWDKENEEYINGYDVLLKYDGSVISRYALVTFDTDMPVNVIIEQSTGLIDKNGKKIYEGDIFRNTINGGTWRVSWDEDDATFWVDSGIDGCSLGEFNYDRRERECGFIRKNCEVIGNIHENLELLKGEEDE